MFYSTGRRYNNSAAVTMSSPTATIDYDVNRPVAYPFPVFGTGSQVDVTMPPPTVIMAQSGLMAKADRLNGSLRRRQDGGEPDVKSFCCVPTGCSRYLTEPIDPADPGNAVRVTCSNPGCAVGSWMHGDCFEQWDRQADYLLRYQQARGCGFEDTTTRMMLAGRSRVCICGRGFLSADPTYPLLFSIPSIINDRTTAAAAVMSAAADKQHLGVDAVKASLNGLFQQQLIQHQLEPQRLRSGSFSSTGSGSHCSSSSSIGTGNGVGGTGYGNGRSGSTGSSSSTPPLSPPRPAATSAFFPNGCADGLLQAPTSDSLPVGGNRTGYARGAGTAVFRHQNAGVSRRNDSGGSTTSSGSAGSSHGAELQCQTVPVYVASTSTPSVAQHQQQQLQQLHGLPTSARGNIFEHRSDLSLYRIVRTAQRNSFGIRLDDEGPHGNDDIRSFLMRRLTTARVSAFQCVACRCTMPVYDEFPIVDGTLFLSPRSHGNGNDTAAASAPGSTPRISVPIVRDRRMMNLHAICLACLGAVGSDDGPTTSPDAATSTTSADNEAENKPVELRRKRTLRCRFCMSPWSIGPTLILGTMYAYDVFASQRCCAARRCCRRCGNQRSASSSNCSAEPQHFSDFSRLSACLHCGLEDYHHVRTFDEAFLCEYEDSEQQCVAVGSGFGL